MIPYIAGLHPSSPLYSYIPLNLQHNCYVVATNETEPITGQGIVDTLHSPQRSGSTTEITMTFGPGEKSTTTNLETYCMHFDSSMLGLRYSHIATCKEKPDTKSSYHACLDTEYRHERKMAAFAQYDKNTKNGLYSKPVPHESLPKNTKVL